MKGSSKYRFNEKTLSYEKVEKKLSVKLMQFIGFTFVVIIIAAGISMLFLSNYDTPEMKSIKKENQQLLSQYNTLNNKLSQIESVLDEIQIRDDNIYRVIFDSDPIPASVRKAGFGGTDVYSELESFEDADIVLNTSKKIDIISKQAYIQAKSYKDVLKLALEKEKETSSVPAIMPISNGDLSFTSSGFGLRMHPIHKVQMFHWGMDFVARKGTKIYATGDGVIKMVRTSRTGHGKHVMIDHDFGYETLYGHLSKFNVKVGQKVKRGEVIGFVGSTGDSTAPHLHYEVHKNGRKINPVNYYFKDLSPEKYEEIIALSSNIRKSFD